MTATPLEAFLGTADLDELVTTYDALPTDIDPRPVRGVVDAWAPAQAVANLLMRPALLPADVRVATLVRGLREPGYTQLAAAVGVGHLEVRELVDDERRDLLEAMLDVVATDAGPAGLRASAELGPLLRPGELTLLDELAGHPVPGVRHNLLQAQLRITDPARREPVLLPYLPNLADYPATRPST